MLMKKTIGASYILMALLAFSGCKNRDINEGEEFKPREIHENMVFNFDKIEVDGVEYLILEKDNNNPHEGFGFMAFRANKLMEKQDTLLALLKTIKDIQVKTYMHISNRNPEIVQQEADQLYHYYLNQEGVELEELNKNELRGISNPQIRDYDQ